MFSRIPVTPGALASAFVVVLAVLPADPVTAAPADPVPVPAASRAATAATGSGYVPVPQIRIWEGVVTTKPTVIPIRGTVTPFANAVVINTEIAGPSDAGYLRVTPAGTDPQVATQVFAKGQRISNSVTVKMSDDNAIQAKVSRGTARVYIDLLGYYDEGGGSRYHAVPNARVFGGTVGTTPTRVQLAGRGGVPADAESVVVTVGLQSQTADGYVRVTPAGRDPQVSTQTYTRSTAISATTIVHLNAGGLEDQGAAQVKVSRGTSTVYFDVVGYYSHSFGGAEFFPVDTVRAFAGTQTTTVRTARLTGVSGIPGAAVAVVANAQVSGPTEAGYVRITPQGIDAQVAAQAFAAGQAISNATVTQVRGSGTDRRVQTKVSRGAAHLYLDVAGYFMKPTRTC